MQQPFRACLITLATIAAIDLSVAGFDSAIAQSSQLNPAHEQALKQGLASQPAHSVPGFTGQVGSKLPPSETAQPLPSDVQTQVPEVKELLFIKLTDRILLIDPDSKAVAQIIMAPETTGTPAGSSGR